MTYLVKISYRNIMKVPLCKTVIASRAFSNYTPRLWNGLPQSLRNCVATMQGSNAVILDSFKCMLKTFLFSIAFGDGIV
jgi:hypothetical protein